MDKPEQTLTNAFFQVTQVTVDARNLPSGETDWVRVDAMTDEEVYADALADPDAQPVSEERLQRFKHVRCAEERLYLEDDATLGIQKSNYGEDTFVVINRHISRYVRAREFLLNEAFNDDSTELTAQSSSQKQYLRVLDIACGSGYGSRYLQDFIYVGVDHDETAIEFARKHYGVCDTALRLSFIQEDALSFCRAEWFDAVVSIETLEHLFQQDQPAFIRLLVNSLCDDGLLFLTVPLGDGGKPANPHHLHEPTVFEMMSMLLPHFGNIGINTTLCCTTSGEQQLMAEFRCSHRRKL